MTRNQMHNTLRYVREQLADERGSDFSGVKALDMVLEELEQEPKTGYWIEERNDYGELTAYHCSNCYEDTGFTTNCAWDFCPSCGARMVKQKESEE